MYLGPTLDPLSVASNAKTTGTLKRPTSLSRHASAAGFPLSGASSWTLGRGHRSPLTAASPAEPPIEGPCPDAVEDISHLLVDVARFAEGLENLKDCVLRDGESQRGQRGLGGRPRWIDITQTLWGQGRIEGRTEEGSEGGHRDSFVEEATAAKALRDV